MLHVKNLFGFALASTNSCGHQDRNAPDGGRCVASDLEKCQ